MLGNKFFFLHVINAYTEMNEEILKDTHTLFTPKRDIIHFVDCLFVCYNVLAFSNNSTINFSTNSLDFFASINFS